ncbi:MAG: hypothetical protein ACREK9_01110 [Candidatus Rokuibacteriota bacterium]
MTPGAWLPPRPVVLAVGAVAAVMTLGWALGHVMPPPLSGYLAFIVVASVAIQLYKSRPGQRAGRLFRVYLRARERGAGEEDARRRLLERHADAGAHGTIARAVEGAWAGPSEPDRLVAGVDALLAHRGRKIDHAVLAAAYGRERNRFSIPGWLLLPAEFVREVRGRLDERERSELDALMDRYTVFKQRFFARPSSLGVDPRASATDFARLLHSMGNRLGKEQPGDAERAYRLSLRVRPAQNLAHAGLALLLAATGRDSEASREARTAIEVLDDYARRAGEQLPRTEDISPFRSPASLREALERLLAPGPGARG